MFSALSSLLKSSLNPVFLRSIYEKEAFIRSNFPLISVVQTRELGKTTRKRRKVRPREVWARKNSGILNDYVTAENKELLHQAVQDTFPGTSTTTSILKDGPWERGTWTPGSKRTGVICRKIGIYPMWTKSGERILTTLLQVVDNHVIKYHPPEIVQQHRPFLAKKKPGMGILVVGAESTNPEKFTGQYLGLFKEAGVCPKKKLTRFFVTPNAALSPGTPLYASHFRPGEYVNAYGKTVDHGFQGVVKRWGFKGGPKANGCTKSHRRPGNIGAGAGHADNVWKGTKLPGHMGSERRLLPGLKVWRVNTKYNVIWVHGPAIPGSVNSYVYLLDTMIPKKAHKEDNPPHFPTAYQDEWENIPEELYDDQLHNFSDPSITYSETEKATAK